MKCPKCGSKDCHLTISNTTVSHSKGYGCLDACCGYVLLGPVGLLCGMCGSGKVTTKSESKELWVCNECGSKFTSQESVNSKIIKAEFYYEHITEYPQYAQYPMIKSFTDIYASELMVSPLSGKILTRNENNQKFIEHKNKCGDSLEGQLVLFALEDETGLIVTLQKLLINDSCIDIDSIKTILMQGRVIYINDSCVRFSTEENVTIAFEVLHKVLNFKTQISYEKLDTYEEVIQYLQEKYPACNSALWAHYSSQKEYKEYVSNLSKDAWESLKKQNPLRYEKYIEYKEAKKKLVVPIGVSILLVTICTAIFSFTVANLLGVLCFSAVAAGFTAYLGYSVYKWFANIVDKFNLELLPKELIELQEEEQSHPIKKKGTILYTDRNKYVDLPGLKNLNYVKEYGLMKYALQISWILCAVFVLVVAGLFVYSSFDMKSKDMETNKVAQQQKETEKSTEKKESAKISSETENSSDEDYSLEGMKAFSTPDGSVSIYLNEDWITEDVGSDTFITAGSVDGREAFLLMQFPKGGVYQIDSIDALKELVESSYGISEPEDAERFSIPGMTNILANIANVESDGMTAKAYLIYGETDYAYYSLGFVASNINERIIDSFKASCSTFSETSNDIKNNIVEGTENNSYALSQYEGTWWDLNSQRCYMEITEDGNKLSITVNWSSGAFDGTEWSMTGMYDAGSDKFRYNDCTLKYIHYNDNGSSTEEIAYSDGTGAIYIADNGYLYWEDDKEQAGDSCYFEKEDDNTWMETEAFNTGDEFAPAADWMGTYIAEDDQTIIVSSADDTGVVLTFVGYSEEGWQTKTDVLSYRNTEKTQVSDPYYYEGNLVQETVYTITDTGIQVETLPSGGWADEFYLRQ